MEEPRVRVRIIPALAGNTLWSKSDPGFGWDHPRSRGEYLDAYTSAELVTGSSPLSRGIPGRPGRVGARLRIIPALAGNTSRLSPRTGRGWGSSPLSRGIPVAALEPLTIIRIIPALAGNTTVPPRSAFRRADHPRSRGEYLNLELPSWVRDGSSPLSRGILGSAVEQRSGVRIIPALAGNTPPRHSEILLRGDHPRSRGEYCSAASQARSRAGSSPLSRGIRDEHGTGRALDGIIPALAGNTWCGSFWWVRSGDHPRSRGEYFIPALAETARWGSSPLSRGIHAPQGAGHDAFRIIPALAGNTPSATPPAVASTDHPRSRGEYPHSRTKPERNTGSSPLSRGIPAAPMGTDGGGSGSSPLSRGIPLSISRHDSRQRIIPALAGNTPAGL